MENDRADVIQAIRETKNLREAARRLGMPRRTLQRRMREYGIARGKAGRPKKRFSSHRKRSYAVAGVAAVAVATVAVLASRRSA